jgi:hypothetical protein
MTRLELGRNHFELNSLHGLHDPTTSTPARAPISARRTSNVDMIRPHGMTETLELIGNSRDLYTDSAGNGHLAGSASMDASIAFFSGRTLTALRTTPEHSSLQRLVGSVAASGFRAKTKELVPQLHRGRSPLFILLDDIPVATLISGHAVGASGISGIGKSGYVPVADQCAGFVSGGLLMNSFEKQGSSVTVTGPDAPTLEDRHDPQSWHRLEVLPLHAMRRRRRIDIRRTLDDALHSGHRSTVDMDAMFRDSYVRADGVETIIHEYTLTATIDADSLLILTAEATPRVLPWQECPGAVASASRIAGMTLQELDVKVRAELRGTSTCTHLNDLLRSVADVSALLDILSEQNR